MQIHTDAVASSLAARYVHAVAVYGSATEYYENLITSISPADISEWEREMSHAEANRLRDLQMMDVIGTRDVEADFTGSTAPGLGYLPRCSPAVTDWLQLALDIQEQQ